jgi:hypothetical protein
MLQDQRKSRRRPQLIVYESDSPPAETPTPRERALDVAIGQIERACGRGVIPQASPPQPGQPQSAKAKVAAGKPRDAKGHFIKRERAAGAGPATLAELTGTEEELLAALAPPPTKAKAKRPNLIQIADEVGDDELDAVIAALVQERERRRVEGDEEK